VLAEQGVTLAGAAVRVVSGVESLVFAPGAPGPHAARPTRRPPAMAAMAERRNLFIIVGILPQAWDILTAIRSSPY
jgi:hypothetical protein